MPTVSIIMPTYNRERFLRQAIDSIFAQTFKDFELIVIDDGSTDGTAEYLSLCVDPKIKVLRQENKGVAEARNYGLSAAQGKFIAFLDSDDLWFPGMLEAAVHYFRKNNQFQWVCGGWELINERENTIGDSRVFMPSGLQTKANTDLTKALILKSLFPVHSVLIRKECLQKCGGFNTRLAKFEDWELWIRLAANGCRLSFIDVPFAKWRRHNFTRRSDTDDAFEMTFTRFFDTVFSYSNISMKYGYLRLHAEILLLLRYAVHFEEQGLMQYKIRCFKRAEQIFSNLPNNEEILISYDEILSKLSEENKFVQKIKAQMPFFFTHRRLSEKVWNDYKACCKDISRAFTLKTFTFLIMSHPYWLTKKVLSKIKKQTIIKQNEINEKIYKTFISQKMKFYKYLNHKKGRVFLYTDSRGFQIGNEKWKKDPFHFYPGYFLKNYNVDLCLCPEKHTTILDFIRAFESHRGEYDFVIAHVAIVDFSPRPKSAAVNQIYKIKKDYYDKIFGEKNMLSHFSSDLGAEYEGEKTINMFSLKMAENYLIPYLKKIPKLFFIGCNNFVKGWEGNYFRERPKNISIVEEYSKLFCKELPYSVDISDWSEDEIKKYTWDNLHLTEEGGEIVLYRLLTQMERKKLKKEKHAK